MIEGLEAVTSPVNVNKGHLEMPVEFDQNRFVGAWFKRGPQANKMRQPEVLGGAQIKAAGWSVWKDSKGRTCQRSLSSGVYILMFRPKNLQQAIQKIYGNESRRRMVQEASGQTVAGDINQDSGILTNSVLSRMPGLERDEVEPLNIEFNQIGNEDDAATKVATAVATTKGKTKKK